MYLVNQVNRLPKLMCVTARVEGYYGIYLFTYFGDLTQSGQIYIYKIWNISEFLFLKIIYISNCWEICRDLIKRICH